MEENGVPSPTETKGEPADSTPTPTGDRPPLSRSESTAGHNLYKVLGLEKDATGDDIKKAYRKLALRHHPDKNLDDPHASELFKEINYANAIISNPTKRQVYDAYGSMGIQMMDTIGEENFSAFLLMKNKWFKLFCCCSAIFTGCFCCCCCCCCCNFCCGKCKPKMEEYENAEDILFDEEPPNDQNDQTPIISQPGPTSTPKASPTKYEDPPEPERPTVIAMPPPPVRTSSPSEQASLTSTPSSQVSYGTHSPVQSDV